MSAVDEDDDIPEPDELLQEVVEEVLDALGLDDAEVTVTAERAQLIATVTGEELGRFIGRHGQTIDAVQHLAQRIVFQGERSETRVIVDADGYRARREEELRSQGDRAADQAVRTGRAVELDAMPAAERRVVHEHLRLRGGRRDVQRRRGAGAVLVVSPAAAS